MANKRGNPNWGKKIDSPLPVELTGFEKVVRELRLDPENEAAIARSVGFREWAHRNHRTRYVPESLLLAIGIEVAVEWDYERGANL